MEQRRLPHKLVVRPRPAQGRYRRQQYERQVDVLRRNNSTRTRQYIGLLNSWTIKLSDPDTMNYALSLTLTVALQLFAVVTSTRHGTDEGTLLSSCSTSSSSPQSRRPYPSRGRNTSGSKTSSSGYAANEAQVDRGASESSP
ncbi:hypothetical protein AB0E63_44845 [Kribbella sp. NPDC026596]|uniref:hypothetical protein n=1 Tax=Kribbella sp. NPDC026596 TaxID=3155122 RepID=UPI0033C9C245